MVRKVICIVFSILFVLCCPLCALAEDDGDNDNSEVVTYTVAPDYTTRLDTLNYSVQNVRDSVDSERSEIVGHLQTIEQLMNKQDIKTIEEPTKSDETKELEKIGKRLEGIQETLEEKGVEIEEQQPVTGNRANVTFTAYANASPSNQYALYSEGFMPRMGFKDHYAFLQDTSSSYVLIWGEISKSGSNIVGNAQYVRWYFANQNMGYLQESGNGNITVNPNGHVIMSDIDGYPMLGVDAEILRKEVGYYALVAICVYCLASVLRFCVRLSSHYS